MCWWMQWWMVWWMPLGVMECSPEPLTGWAEAGATAIATITIIRATTLNNTNMCLFMCYAFPKGGLISPAS